MLNLLNISSVKWTPNALKNVALLQGQAIKYNSQKQEDLVQHKICKDINVLSVI